MLARSRRSSPASAPSASAPGQHARRARRSSREPPHPGRSFQSARRKLSAQPIGCTPTPGIGRPAAAKSQFNAERKPRLPGQRVNTESRRSVTRRRNASYWSPVRVRPEGSSRNCMRRGPSLWQSHDSDRYGPAEVSNPFAQDESGNPPIVWRARPGAICRGPRDRLLQAARWTVQDVGVTQPFWQIGPVGSSGLGTW